MKVTMKMIREAGKQMQDLMDCGPKPIRHAQAVISKKELLADIERESTELVEADKQDFTEESWEFLKDEGFLTKIYGGGAANTDEEEGTDTDEEEGTDTGEVVETPTDSPSGEQMTDAENEKKPTKKPGKKTGTKKAEKKPADKKPEKVEKKKVEKVVKEKVVKEKVVKEKTYSRYDAAVAAAKEGGTKAEQITMAAKSYAVATNKPVNEREAGWLYGTILKAAKVGNFTLDKDGNLQA